MMKMFVVQKQISINKTVRMPEDLIDKLEAIAEKEGVSFNKLVIQCCEYALGQMEESKHKHKKSPFLGAFSLC